MKKTSYITGALATIMLLAVAACSKMDDYKDEFLESGEIQYTGKADSVKFHAGYNRAQLSWLILSDPKVTKAKIYWNFRKDSIETDIQRTTGVDTIRVMIPNLPEGTQNFEIFTFDKKGNTSIPSPISGKVGGERYEASLLHRGIDWTSSQLIAIQPPYHMAMLVWKSINATDGIIGMQLKYTDEDNVAQKVLVTPQTPTTMLMKYAPGSDIEYKTLYQPDSLAIDTFYTRAMIIKLD